MKTSITSISKNELKLDKTTRRKEWMTDTILNLMEERRQYRHPKPYGKYEEIHKKVQKSIKEAKERWLQEKAQEIENLQAKYDSFNLHKKIKEATGAYQRKGAGVILNSDNTLIFETDKKLARWKQYMEELFEDESINSEENK